MRNAFTPNARRTRPPLLLAQCGLLVALAMTAACPECDPDLCEEECDEAYPIGEAERDACWLACAEEAEACRDRRR